MQISYAGFNITIILFIGSFVIIGITSTEQWRKACIK